MCAEACPTSCGMACPVLLSCSYEAYGPGGTGFVIEALTDNVNRTAGAALTALERWIVTSYHHPRSS
jgi:hypothetical protein